MINPLIGLGFKPELVRGKVYLDGMPVHMIVGKVPVSLERRRYSNATFCWAEAYVKGQWVSLGDPWQAVTPKLRDIAAEIQRAEHDTYTATATDERP